MSLLLLWNAGVTVAPTVTVSGTRVRRRRRERDEPRRREIVYVHDELGPPAESPVPEWLRSEQDLAALILWEVL
jgi:hypothetical protein